MRAEPWSFTGRQYRVAWDPNRGSLSLRWAELLEFPAILPLAAVAPRVGNLPETLSGPPPEPWCRALLKGNPRVSWAGLASGARPVFADHRVEAGTEAAVPGGGGIGWRVECLPDRLHIDTAYVNPWHDDLALHALIPLAGRFRILRGLPSQWRFFKTASNTSLPCGSIALDGSERNFGIRMLPQALLPGVLKRMLSLPHESVRFRKGSFSSQWFTLLVSPDGGPCLLVGFLGSRRHFSTLTLDARENGFQAAAVGDGCLLPPGRSFQAHRLLVLCGQDPHTCVETYLGEFAAPLAPRFRSATLWGSWYAGFYDRFHWPDLEGNLGAAQSAPAKIEFFQLDDGYQKALGDWTETKPCLPEGLQGFAREVSSRGMQPGLWLAPFAVGRDSALSRRHPEWLVRSVSGKPTLAGLMPGRFTLRPYYGLDLTVPEAREWLRQLFLTLVGWGFRLFKLDFLAAGTIPGVRTDRSMTSAEAYAEGLRVIREAVGEVPLLGALAPQFAGVGFLDIQRVSADSSFGGNHWAPAVQRLLGDSITPGLRNNIRNNLSRAFCAGRLWTNDCDAILHGGLSPEEERTHLAVNLLLGDVLQIGFDLRKSGFPWPEIARLTGYRHRARRIPDLFEREVPEEALVVSQDARNRTVLFYLLLNLADAPAEKTLRQPESVLPVGRVLWDLGREFWSGEKTDLRPGRRVRIAPHDSLLLELPVEV